MDEAAREFGRIDGLLNNAGWYPRATLEETTTEFWDRIQQVNLRGPFYCCKHAARHLRAAGGGSILNVGSLNGIQGLPNLVALPRLPRGSAFHDADARGRAGGRPIGVNYLIPGWILTEAKLPCTQSRARRWRL